VQQGKEGPYKMQETDLQTHTDMEGKSSPMHRTKATAAQQNKTNRRCRSARGWRSSKRGFQEKLLEGANVPRDPKSRSPHCIPRLGIGSTFSFSFFSFFQFCDDAQMAINPSFYLAKFGDTQNRKVKKQINVKTPFSYCRHLWLFLAI